MTPLVAEKKIRNVYTGNDLCELISWQDVFEQLLNRFVLLSLQETGELVEELCRNRKLSDQELRNETGQGSQNIKTIKEKLSKSSKQIRKRRDLLDSSVDFHEKAKTVS